MSELIAIEKKADIPKEFQDTPIGLLLEYHNLDRPFDIYSNAKLLVGMCMDSRKHLHIPENFSYIIRSGGANMRYSEFKISYAIAVANINHIALIGHSQCGMVNLIGRRNQFIEGLVSVGWTKDAAEEHFYHYAPMYEIGNEIDFVRSETKRLNLRYPKVVVAAFLYKVEDNRLYWIKEKV